MSKTAITWLFIGAILAVVGGVLIGLFAVVAALAGGTITFGGQDVVTVTDDFAATLLWLLVASVAIAGGGIAALVAWVGALLNTVQLEDKTWFVALLILGLISFGWIATAAYIVAGPDSTKQDAAYPGGATVPSS